MLLQQFLEGFNGSKNFRQLITGLKTPPGEKFHLNGLIGSSKTILITNAFTEIDKNIVILLNDREEAAYFYDDLNNLGLGENTFFFPSSFKRSIQYGETEQENIVQRAEVLTSNFAK